MSTLKNQTNNLTAQTNRQHAEKCVAIISKFTNPSIPLAIRDFKNMLFYSLHDAYVHRDDSAINDEQVAVMYYLWEILEEIEEL